MFVVGLTGGIASGKTTISDIFLSLGAAVVDTDIISRSLLEPGQKGFDKVLAKMGSTILLETGHIDRGTLRHLVFNDEKLKIWLESILHPLILKSCWQQIDDTEDSPYVILVVPLLFEANFTTLVDRIVAVDCSREVQLKRLTCRDKIDIRLAQKIISQQMPNEARISRADDVIENNADKSELMVQVSKLHQLYSLRASSELS